MKTWKHLWPQNDCDTKYAVWTHPQIPSLHLGDDSCTGADACVEACGIWLGTIVPHLLRSVNRSGSFTGAGFDWSSGINHGQNMISLFIVRFNTNFCCFPFLWCLHFDQSFPLSSIQGAWYVWINHKSVCFLSWKFLAAKPYVAFSKAHIMSLIPLRSFYSNSFGSGDRGK